MDNIVGQQQSAELGPVERLIIGADSFPWTIFPRAALGYAVVPVWHTLTDGERSDWTLFPFFLAVLIAVRFVPVVLRRLLPFGKTTLAVWLERRLVAKRFDSYQWQKLLWVGIGLAGYALFANARFSALTVLTAFCLVSGASGFVIWEVARRKVDSRSLSVRNV